MEENQQLIPSNPDVKNPRPSWPKLAAVGGVILVVVLAAALFFANQAQHKGQAPAGNAADTFYNMLGNAAKQQKLRVAMYRETFANKADADAGKNQGSIASSVSELDTTTGNYRSVFAHDYLAYPRFTIGRCLDGTTYQEAYGASTPNPGARATSLKDVSGHLKLLPDGHLFKVTEALTFIACPYVGLLPQAVPHLATARLADGVFPVTLSASEADTWVSKVKEVDLFDVKDDGLTQKDGRNLRKLSFSPKGQITDANKRLYDFFYEAAQIDRLKAERPKATWQHGFISINPFNTGNVGGFYLIDEKTNLPVYSELYGTNPDKKTNESLAAGKNIARTKQNYAYPQQLTIDLNSPLEFLQ